MATIDPEMGRIDAHLEQNRAHERRQRSLWRSAYERVSQNNPDHEERRALESSSKRKSRRSWKADQRVRVYDDQPPPSILKTYRDNRRASQVLLSSAHASQSLDSSVQDQCPVLSTQENLVRTDTVFYRLFSNPPLRSDGGYTSRSSDTPAVSPSSQSHRTHLPLNAAPVVLTKNVDAEWPIEVAAGHPACPVTVTEDTRKLQVGPAALPASPPAVQEPQDGLDRTDAQLPPSPPPKDGHLPSHRCEYVLDQGVPTVVPTPNPVFDRELTPTPSCSDDQSQYSNPSLHEFPKRQSTPPPLDRQARLHPPESNFVREVMRSPPNRASMRVEVARPTHTFTPQPLRQPRSKGTRRTSMPASIGTSSLPPRRSMPPSNYILSRLPDAHSAPSLPRADQILSRHQHS